MTIFYDNRPDLANYISSFYNHLGASLSIFIVDLGKTISFVLDFGYKYDTLSTGNYLIVGLSHQDLSMFNGSHGYVSFSLRTFGDYKNLVNANTKLVVTDRRSNTRVNHEMLWNSCCLISKRDIEPMMMELDIHGVEYKVVEISK